MKIRNKGLTINNRHYSEKSLKELSLDKINQEGISQWEKDIYSFILEWINDEDHIVQYSSGTTGRPKKFTLQKSSMLSSAKNTCDYLSLKKGDTAVLCLPVEYIAGKMMIVRSYERGLNLILVESNSNPNIYDIGNIDFIAMVPLQVRNLVQRKDIPVRKLIIGGADTDRILEKSLQNIKVEAFATYGMAETCSHIALRRLNGPLKEDYYQILPGIKIGQDKRNCLVIKADYLPLKIVTNDIVELTSETSFRWVGRYDNLINTGGIKVVPEELEKIITSETGMDCAVLGIPDEVFGQKIVLVFEGSVDKEVNTVIERLLIKKLQPKHIILVEKLPRNKSSKIDRQKLAEIIKSKAGN